MISGPLVWRRNAGFTLVEVSLAVLIVSLGLMTVFGLLPSALRMSDDAVTSTRDGLFAETMMAGLRANIALAPPESWTSIADLTVDACGNAIPGIGVISFDSPTNKIVFPNDGDATNVWYRLSIARNGSSENSCSISLILCNDVYGEFKTQAVFYSEFTYMGVTNR